MESGGSQNWRHHQCLAGLGSGRRGCATVSHSPRQSATTQAAGYYLTGHQTKRGSVPKIYYRWYVVFTLKEKISVFQKPNECDTLRERNRILKQRAGTPNSMLRLEKSDLVTGHKGHSFHGAFPPARANRAAHTLENPMEKPTQGKGQRPGSECLGLCAPRGKPRL